MSSISTNNLSIKFRVYHDRSPSLKEFAANIFKHEKIPAYTDFFAIKNVTLSVQAGDRIGIIGHNGAGKSTFLKSICKIYETFEGDILVTGKIAPLLEIGAGFHPEFTGRENIHLNGAILGYTKEQLKTIESEIIAFAELEEFIDTAVKYYSTGMYMRLAFSLATAVDPDILVLDEIFAGGDASFIGKAKNRMSQMIDRANILIMVSHDHHLIAELCNRVIWLDHGKVIADGSPKEILERYLNGQVIS